MTSSTYDNASFPLKGIVTNIRFNELFFMGLLTVIAVMNISDFVVDFQEGSETLHLLQEAFLVVASIGGIGYLIWEVTQRRQELEAVKQQLFKTRDHLSVSNEKLKGMGKKYREVIDQQLTDWSFTPSEKDVAFLLLKGLSFEEVAGVRETKEKTVRQQASAIYRKSGVSSRYEFAAWFFEDLL